MRKTAAVSVATKPDSLLYDWLLICVTFDWSGRGPVREEDGCSVRGQAARYQLQPSGGAGIPRLSKGVQIHIFIFKLKNGEKSR